MAPAPGGGRAEREGTGRGERREGLLCEKRGGAEGREGGGGSQLRASRARLAGDALRPPRGQGSARELDAGGKVASSISVADVGFSFPAFFGHLARQLKFCFSELAIKRYKDGGGQGGCRLGWGLKANIFCGGCKEICKIIKTKLVTQYVFV